MTCAYFNGIAINGESRRGGYGRLFESMRSKGSPRIDGRESGTDRGTLESAAAVRHHRPRSGGGPIPGPLAGRWTARLLADDRRRTLLGRPWKSEWDAPRDRHGPVGMAGLPSRNRHR